MRSGATPSARQRRTRFVPPCATMASAPPAMRRDDLLEGRPRARGKLREILAVGKLIAGDVGHPRRVRVGVERPDLLSRESLPSPHRELPQRGPLDGHEAVGRGDDRGAPTGPDEIARVHRVEGGPGQVFGDGGDLPLAER